MRRAAALLALLPLFGAGGSAAKEPARAQDAVAIVCIVSGRVQLYVAGQERRDLRAFEWLGAGVRVDVPQDGRVVLAFRDGRGQELPAGTRARLETGGAVAQRGSVRDLPPLPVRADVLALMPEETARSQAGVVPVRGPGIGGLSPARGAARLAHQTVLSFEPVRGALQYRVEVRDASGVRVFETVAKGPTVAVPPGALRAGARYTWKVRTADRPGPVVEGVEAFHTLDAAAVEALDRLRREVAAAGDASALALLAETDRRLGLLGFP